MFKKKVTTREMELERLANALFEFDSTITTLEKTNEECGKVQAEVDEEIKKG